MYAILKLFADKNKALVIVEFFVLDLGLHIIDSGGELDFQSDRPLSKRLHEDLHVPAKMKNKICRDEELGEGQCCGCLNFRNEAEGGKLVLVT